MLSIYLGDRLRLLLLETFLASGDIDLLAGELDRLTGDLERGERDRRRGEEPLRERDLLRGDLRLSLSLSLPR